MAHTENPITVVDQEESGHGLQEDSESCPSVQKEIDWIAPPPPLLTPGVPQILLEQALVWGPLGTFSADCPESPTSGTYASGGCLFSSVVLYRPDMELRVA